MELKQMIVDFKKACYKATSAKSPANIEKYARLAYNLYERIKNEIPNNKSIDYIGINQAINDFNLHLSPKYSLSPMYKRFRY